MSFAITSRPWVVFDVESIGLHGEAFAVGWVVIDDQGRELEARREACPPAAAVGTDNGRNWVRDHIPALPATMTAPVQLRHAFWAAWTVWKGKGALLIADNGWPVESRFLAACVDDTRPAVKKGQADSPRDFGGPYPLHELATLMLIAGMDPFNRGKRRPEELPEHDPLADARFSARQLMEAQRIIRGQG